MSKYFQIATLAGALTLAMSSASAITLDFGGWVAGGEAGGDIDHSQATVCTQANMSCSVIASGLGFKQLMVNDANDQTGSSYIMTIVTDQNAKGTAGSAELGFSDVSFVKMKLTLGGATSDVNQNGITAHQEIKENLTGTSFISTSDINTGWALDPATSKAPIVISQELKDDGIADFTGDDFESGFLYRSHNSTTAVAGGDPVDSGIRDGFEMSIDQTAGLASGTSSVDNASKDDIQVFALRQKQGVLLSASSAPINLNSDTSAVSWDAGDNAKAIWIGQQVNLDTKPLAAGETGGLGSSFGYLSFQNTTALEYDAQGNPTGLGGDKTVESAFGFTGNQSLTAWKWDSEFNVAGAGEGAAIMGTPCLADAKGVIGDPLSSSVCTQIPAP
ncbi:MAG: hypothetical protein OEM38_04475 [Gammaproteobacteria bacterium]|nr:hypothetical protein [Gammaproteobacteria bacterium]